MKILLCHNSYKQRGGEDVVFEAESRLLQSKGHAVIRYHRSNDELDVLSRMQTFRKLFWNRESESEVADLIVREQPDIMHCTNIFPLISPSVYRAAKSHGVPVIQSLHNYRLICPNAIQLRNGLYCEDCSGKPFAWPAVYHGCYRDSRATSAATAAMLAYHKSIGTWSETVDRFIALTDFMRDKLVAGGIAADKIRVKPNFVGNDTGIGDGDGGFAIYVGRLSEEKGITPLLDAWAKLNEDIKLHILGDGPLMPLVKDVANRDTRLIVHGQAEQGFAFDLIGKAAFLIVPSIVQETFGLSVIEAYAKGTPVIGSNNGSFPALIKPGETGMLFESGNSDDLAANVKALMNNETMLNMMRLNARAVYEDKFTADRNYEILRTIYEEVL